MRASTDWQTARVQRATALSPTVTELELVPEAGGPVAAWSPGSHLPVQVPLADGRIDQRHYSLVGPAEPGGWRIAVKRCEPSRGGSAHLSRLQPGDRLRHLPPHNHFELPPGRTPTLLLAGGIGITPLVSMALALAARGAPLRLAYAARSRAELVYAERLRAALGGALQTFAGDAGERLDLAAEIAALPPDGQALVCGPLTLMQAVQAAWAEAGRPAERLRFETFGASGHAPAQAFRVMLPRHGLTLEVPADRSLLDVLEGAGVEVLSDCRRGECGLCALPVLQLPAGAIDHRDVFFTPQQRAGNQQLCACVSRLCGSGATVVLDTAWRADGDAARAA